MGIVSKHRETRELSHPVTYSGHLALFRGKKVLRYHQSNDQNRCSEKRTNRAPTTSKMPEPKRRSSGSGGDSGRRYSALRSDLQSSSVPQKTGAINAYPSDKITSPTQNSRKTMTAGPIYGT